MKSNVWLIYLYKAEAPVSFLVAVCSEPSQHVHARKVYFIDDLYPSIYMGVVNILAHLRFKSIVSC